MPSLEMEDLAYYFNDTSIDEYVTESRPGNYALGYVHDDIFIVRYVGRSEHDLKDELKSHIGSPYQRFKFSYSLTPQDAFEKECRVYHRFGGNKKLHNLTHPNRGSHFDWKCPVCSIYDQS